MSGQSTPADDRSSRLEDARKIRRALDSFSSGYASSKVQLDRNLLAERIEAFKKEIMQQVEAIKKTLITHVPNYEEVICIIAKYSENGSGIFWVEKNDKKSIPTKWLYEQSQLNTFYVPENDFYAIIDGLLPNVQEGKSDQQLQSTVEPLLYDPIKDFAQNKYGWEYYRVVLEELKAIYAPKKRRRPSPRSKFIKHVAHTLFR